MSEPSASIFTHYAIPLDETTIISDVSLLMLPTILDSLGCQDNHHILLTHLSSQKIEPVFFVTIASQLKNKQIDRSSKHAECLYFNLADFLIAEEDPKKIVEDFSELCRSLSLKNKIIIFIIHPIELFFQNSKQAGVTALAQCLKSILANPNWRLMTTTAHSAYPEEYFHFKKFFSVLKFVPLKFSQQELILRMYQKKLEKLHQVIITDEIYYFTQTLVKRFFCGEFIENNLMILDYASLRAQREQKSIVGINHVTDVVSHLINIPTAYLNFNLIQMVNRLEKIKEKVIGQTDAVQRILFYLQNAYFSLNKSSGPLCSFMFVGPHHVGKALLIETLVESLFSHKQYLFRLSPSESSTRLSDWMVTVDGPEPYAMSLLTALKTIPFGVFWIEESEKRSPYQLLILEEILKKGYVFDNEKRKYDFRQAIIILTTTVSSEQMKDFIPEKQQKNKSLDLMQLVLMEQLAEDHFVTPACVNLEEIRLEILYLLRNYFSQSLLDHVRIIPFLPLDYEAYEKIITLHLQKLAHHTQIKLGIELKFAPEIIKFLAQAVFWQHKHEKAFAEILEETLYKAINHELHSITKNNQSIKALFLKLNLDGQLLQCEPMLA